MQRAKIMTLAAAALMLPAGATGQAFEGTIKTLMSAAGMEIQMDQHVSGTMSRQDMTMPGPGGSMSVITDAAENKTIMVIHSQKMWMDMAAMSQMMANMPGMGRGRGGADEEPTELPELRRTDRVETIAGFECRHFIVAHESGEVDICAATGMGFFMPGGPPSMGPMMGGRGGPPAMPRLPRSGEVWARQFRDGFFVLKLEAQSREGNLSLVVQSIERKSLPDEMFRVPADYTEMKMPGRGGS